MGKTSLFSFVYTFTSRSVFCLVLAIFKFDLNSLIYFYLKEGVRGLSHAELMNCIYLSHAELMNCIYLSHAELMNCIYPTQSGVFISPLSRILSRRSLSQDKDACCSINPLIHHSRMSICC